MAGTPDKVLLRDFTCKINTGTVAVPVWTPIGGLDEDGITESRSDRTTDFMDANSGGAARPRVIGRSYTYTLKGARLEAASDGTRDPGQAAVELLQDEVVADNMAQFQIESPPAATPETITFMAAVSVAGLGDTSNKASWGATLLVDGIPTRA
jgi:hypothetical protein